MQKPRTLVALFPTYYTFSQPIPVHPNGSDTTVSPKNDLIGRISSPTHADAKSPFARRIFPLVCFWSCVSTNEKTRIRPLPMTKQSTKPEIMGTRTGYVIRFTCPVCTTENLIVNKTPRDHYKETRDASCTKCRRRSTILTPNGPVRRASPAPVIPVISPVL